MGDITKLEVWKLSLELATDVYKLTQKGNLAKDFSFRDQIRRAAISIPSNIAEGFRRNYKKEFGRFLRIALGSCGELETQLIIAHERNYFGTEIQPRGFFGPCWANDNKIDK